MAAKPAATRAPIPALALSAAAVEIGGEGASVSTREVIIGSVTVQGQLVMVRVVGVTTVNFSLLMVMVVGSCIKPC